MGRLFWRTLSRNHLCLGRSKQKTPLEGIKASVALAGHVPLINGRAGEDKSATGAFLSFSGDAEEGEDVAVDLFGEATKAAEEADADADDDDDDEEDAEPEDDFNAAWEVLDLARAIFEKQQDESDEVKLKLAEVFVTLGDVSLETGAS